MIEALIQTPVLVETDSRGSGADLLPREQSLSRLLATYRAVLCSIAPDASGSVIIEQVVAAIAGRSCRLGFISTVPFELPLDASACLFPTPLDRRARLIVERQRQIDRMITELGVKDAEIFVTAGTPRSDIREVARLWQADIVLYGCSARTGLRAASRRAPNGFDVVGLGNDGRPASRSALRRLFGC